MKGGVTDSASIPAARPRTDSAPGRGVAEGSTSQGPSFSSTLESVGAAPDAEDAPSAQGATSAAGAPGADPAATALASPEQVSAEPPAPASPPPAALPPPPAPGAATAAADAAAFELLVDDLAREAAKLLAPAAPKPEGPPAPALPGVPGAQPFLTALGTSFAGPRSGLLPADVSAAIGAAAAPNEAEPLDGAAVSALLESLGSSEWRSGASGASSGASASPALLAATATTTTTAATTAPGTAAPPPRVLASPVGSEAWGEEIGARLAWMIGRGEQIASVALNPEALGPLEIRVAIREGEASVWFTATAAETRTALEQALPRLRELLAGAGIALAHSGVSAEGSRDPWKRLNLPPRDEPGGGVEGSDAGIAPLARRVATGLVDLYA